MKKIYFYFFYGLISLQLSAFAAEDDKENKSSHPPASPSKRFKIAEATRNHNAIQVIGAPIKLPATVQVFDLFQVPNPELAKQLKINGNPSGFFYSEKYPLYFVVTEQIRDLMAFSDYLKSGTHIVSYKQKEMVSRFMNGFDKIVATPSTSIPNLQDFRAYFDQDKLKYASLNNLLKVYKDNENLMRLIALKDEEGEIAYEETNNMEAFELQYEENYSRLINQRVFTNLLRNDCQFDLDVNASIYELTRKWHYICESFIASAALGSSTEYAQTFFSTIILPGLEKLFINPKAYYDDITIFSYDDIESLDDTKSLYGTRLHMVKFKIADSDKIFTMVLYGSRPKPTKTPQAKSKKDDSNCILS